jgi:DNA-binding IclR family transcriptional regulator
MRKLSLRRRTALQFIVRRPRSPISEIAHELGLGAAQTRKCTEGLRSQGMVSRARSGFVATPSGVVALVRALGRD